MQDFRQSVESFSKSAADIGSRLNHPFEEGATNLLRFLNSAPSSTKMRNTFSAGKFYGDFSDGPEVEVVRNASSLEAEQRWSALRASDVFSERSVKIISLALLNGLFYFFTKKINSMGTRP